MSFFSAMTPDGRRRFSEGVGVLVNFRAEQVFSQHSTLFVLECLFPVSALVT